MTSFLLIQVMDKIAKYFKFIAIIQIVEIVAVILSLMAITQGIDNYTSAVSMHYAAWAIAVIASLAGAIITFALRKSISAAAPQVKGISLLAASFIVWLVGILIGADCTFGVSLPMVALAYMNVLSIIMIALPICYAGWVLLWISAIKMTRHIPSMNLVKLGAGGVTLAPIIFMLYTMVQGMEHLPKICNLLILLVTVIGLVGGLICIIIGFFKTSAATKKDAILSTPKEGPTFFQRWKIYILIALGIYLIMLIASLILGPRSKDDDDKKVHYTNSPYTPSRYNSDRESKSSKSEEVVSDAETSTDIEEEDIISQNGQEEVAQEEITKKETSTPIRTNVAGNFSAVGSVGKYPIEMYLAPSLSLCAVKAFSIK